jgi:hypothetical protein
MMNVRKCAWAVGFVFLSGGILSFAQPPAPPGPGSFKIRSIRQQLVVPPDFKAVVTGVGARSAALAERWLRIEVEFDSQPEWADDVQLKYYVLMGTGREARMFAGEVTHVNVARGARHYSAMFMHPNAVQRYGRGQVQAVAVQLFHQSRLIDQDSSPPTRERWWERYTPVSGFLLNPMQTPWSVIAHERYEALKTTP